MKSFTTLLNNFPTLDSILEEALQNTSQYLSRFIFDAKYTQKLETAFGNDFDAKKANQLFGDFAKGKFKAVPTIEIVNRHDINGANGAYSITTGKIYLAADFISQNANNVDAVVAVLLEEVGHFVDSQINTTDAAGDEGDIFARLVQEDSLSESELAVLRAEDDSATVTLDGQVVEIEQNTGLQGSYKVEQVKFSGDYQIDSLIRYNSGDSWGKWANSSPTSPLDMTYSFYKPGIADYGWDIQESQGNQNDPTRLDDNKNLQELTTQVKNSIRNILTTLGSKVNINFREITEENGKYGQLRYIYKGDAYHRHAYAPDILYNNENQSTHRQGDVFLYNDDLGSQHSINIALHETLHALGLSHPDEYKDGDGNLKQYKPYSLSDDEDSRNNTVMSYRDAVYSSEPAPYDLKALGYLYNLRATGNDSLSGKGTNTNDLYVFDTDTPQGADIINETTIALKTFHNSYVSARDHSEFWNLKGIFSTINDREKFTVINNNDGTIALKTFHNKYVSARNDWESWKLTGISSTINDWEKFTVINNNDGTIALKTFHNKYVSARNGWEFELLKGISSTINDWEKLTFENQNNDKDTLDFSATTTKSINVDLSIAGQQWINEHLSLTLGITIGSQTFIDIENAVGGSLNDTLKGNSLDNLLRGNNGNDILDGKGGIDTLIGGKGNDTYIVDSTTDTIIENDNEGTDTVVSSVTFSLANLPNIENLTLTGTAAIDGTGNTGNNIITGNAAKNTLNGGAGNDTINPGYAPNSIDTVDGGADDDILQVDYSSKGNKFGIFLDNHFLDGVYRIYDLLGSLVEFSNIERFDIIGTQYADIFKGRGGNDIFNGGGGSDTLTGGAGKDTLTGGTGGDTFVYTNLQDSLLNNFDVITDFNAAEDKFQVSNISGEYGFYFHNAGILQGSLSESSINSQLNFVNLFGFQPYYAAIFSHSSGRYLVINDGTAGFQAGSDTIIQLQNLQGTIGASNFIDPNGNVAQDSPTLPDFGGFDGGFDDGGFIGIQSVNNNNSGSVAFTIDPGLGNLAGIPSIPPTQDILYINDGTNSNNNVVEKDIVSGSADADMLIAGVDFDGVSDMVFTGAGNDEVDIPSGGSLTGNNRIFTGRGNDIIFVGNGDRSFGGSGDDELDATDATGYRLSGGTGNDIFYLGADGRALGGEGNDQFYVQEGGGNLISGGAGADQFWIVNGDLPTTANTILDFEMDTDVLGIAGQGAGFDFNNLTFVGNSIMVGNTTVAILKGIDTTSLIPSDFTFV